MQEELADQLLQRDLVPVILGGAGYDATPIFAKLWREGWAQLREQELNPVGFGIRLTGRFYELLNPEDEVPWSALGRLVGRFGIRALAGLEAALARELQGNWLAYATAVAKGQQEEANARKAAANA